MPAEEAPDLWALAARGPVLQIVLSGFAAGISGDSGRVGRSFFCGSVPSACTYTQTERQ